MWPYSHIISRVFGYVRCTKLENFSLPEIWIFRTYQFSHVQKFKVQCRFLRLQLAYWWVKIYRVSRGYRLLRKKKDKRAGTLWKQWGEGIFCAGQDFFYYRIWKITISFFQKKLFFKVRDRSKFTGYPGRVLGKFVFKSLCPFFSRKKVFAPYL